MSNRMKYSVKSYSVLFEPSTFQSNTRCIRLQDHSALLFYDFLFFYDFKNFEVKFLQFENYI